jgi:hypothetical protein
MRRLAPVLLLMLTLTGSGCATLGARTLPEVQSTYAESLAQTLDAQVLTNLVRLRYRDTPSFLDVASLTTQQTLNGSLGVGVELNVPTSTLLKPNLGGSFSVTPTITFAPLRGDEFVRRLVTPVSLGTVTMLCSSGWSISRVLHLTVDRLNDVRNAPRAAGPTPDSPPEYETFVKVAKALRTLQLDDHLSMSTLRQGANGESLLLLMDDTGKDLALAATVREALGLKEEEKRYLFTEDFSSAEMGPLRVRLRSVLSAMFYLSQGVDVPAEHEARGFVTVTKNTDGSRFDWQQVLQGTFRVRTSESEPSTASLKVKHRGHWFYIPDDDLESKSTFLLLMQLSNMQAGRSALPLPLLTIPAGR